MKTHPRSLFDVNFLIALLDIGHIHHQAAVAWFSEHSSGGWASCPITQNGCVRIMSNPRYHNATSVQDAIRRLNKATNTRGHEFWADSVSLFESDLVDWSKASTCRTITDAYLLALAVMNHGCLVTFDRGINIGFVNGAKSHNLAIVQI